MIKKLITILVASLMTFSIVIAETVNDGKDAANRGEFAKALRIWMSLADKGDAEAQYNLGRLYARGDGVKKDFKEAAYWFEKAANRNHRDAADKLSHMYEVGDGVRRDAERARFWRDAAKKKSEEITTTTTMQSRERASSLTDNVPPQGSSTALPEGTIQEGTLCNKKLMLDAQVGIAAKVAMLGCSKPESFKPYVTRNPEGPIGSKAWGEKWIVTGCGTSYPVDVNFSEDGAGSANYAIR